MQSTESIHFYLTIYETYKITDHTEGHNDDDDDDDDDDLERLRVAWICVSICQSIFKKNTKLKLFFAHVNSSQITVIKYGTIILQYKKLKSI